MNLSPLQIKLLGWASFWPLVYGVLFVSFIVKTLVMFFAEAPPQDLFGDMALVFPLHIFTALVMLILLVVYPIHVARNRMLNENSRMFWYLALLAFSVAAFPLYYWMFIRPRPPKGLAE